MIKDYQKPEAEYWTGRATKSPQYWYQQVQLLDFTTDKLDKIDIALVGYQCDEGVRRNQGRVGARQGPNILRQQLGKLPVHFQDKQIADLGNIYCQGQEMEQCQEGFSEITAELIRKTILSIGLGGGHDIAYAHFKGIAKAFQNSGKKRIGIINFDAHFDLRPIGDGLSNSGTPFYQILKEHKSTELQVQYLAIGIQQQSNTRELFRVAAEEGVNWINDYDCTMQNFDSVEKQLTSFISKHDSIYLTIDLDGFSAAYAPGVSAPSPFGLTPDFVRLALGVVLKSKKLIACDIAELNPTYDVDGITAKLGARLVDVLVC